MDKISQNRLLKMSFNNLKLPTISSTSTQSQSWQSLPDSDDHLIPGRRSFMLNPYGIPSPGPLKLPKLIIPPSEKVTSSGESGNRNSPKERVRLPPLKLTKHEQERASNININNKMDRLNMDFDRKLSSVHQSMQNFHKKYSSLTNTMQEAVRRSVSDSARNKILDSMRPRSDRKGMDSYEEKCAGRGRPRSQNRPADLVTEKVSADQTATSFPPPSDNLTQNQRNEDFRPPTPIRLTKASNGESCTQFDDHFSSLSIQGSPERKEVSVTLKEPQPQPDKVYDEDKLSPSLGPIMENLSDKAFLTKLKIKDGQANRTMQKMQNRANVIQNQLHLDKLKAKLESGTTKPLYKPRKEEPPKPTESRQELMGFLQANGGMTGKWVSADHIKFLKIYHAWKGVPELIIEKSIEAFRHKTPAEVMAHAEWYEEFEELIESNKNQVRKWDEGKRKEREMIYHMEAEDRKIKLDDEKRRKEHLKSIRLQEKQRARASASKWKNLKKKSNAINAESVEIDAAGIAKDMLNLAERVQSLANPVPLTERKSIPPHLRQISAKTFSNVGQRGGGQELGQKKVNLSKSAPIRKRTVGRIKLPPLDLNVNDNCQKDAGDGKGIFVQNQYGEQLKGFEGHCDNSQGSDADSSHRTAVSKLKSDTISHKVRKEAQIIKRMEIRSLKGKVPHRVDEIESFSGSLKSYPKKGTPNWRKIS